jgi:hypothetical protein
MDIQDTIGKLRDHGTDEQYTLWKASLGVTLSAYCLLYEDPDSGKRVYYAAGEHTKDHTSDTFKNIDKIVPLCDICIIEGIEYDLGLSPQRILGRINDGRGEGVMQCEIAHAATVAAANNVQFIGLECDDEPIMRKLAEKYTIEDVCGCWILANYNLACNILKLPQEHMCRAIDIAVGSMYKIFSADVSAKNILDEFDFYIWFETQCGKKFKYGKHFHYAYPTPNSPLIFHKIAYDWALMRDRGNMENVLRVITRYNNVCIIIGNRHAYADVLALTHFMRHPPRVLYGT